MNWQLIETAPKDADQLILWNGREVFMGHFWMYYGLWGDENGAMITATHWMPLPEPPK